MNKIIAAFAENKVFANLLMTTILLAGILSSLSMIREDMPDMQFNTISISVSYPGADPEEVEEGISRKIEDAIEGLEGIDDYTSVSSEGSSKVTINVEEGYTVDKLLDRVKNEVDAISTFPEDAERPSISRPQIQKGVISLALVSEMSEARLKEWADRIQKEIQQIPGVSQADISGTRSYEISVEISQADLLKYDLSIKDVADIIAQGSINKSGGTIKTASREIRLRTIGRKYTGNEIGDIKIIKGSLGQTVFLKDIAQIRDGFTENDLSIRVNGSRAALINVLAGDEDTINIADLVQKYQQEKNKELPTGSKIIILSDNTESTRADLDILYSNASIGLVFVFVLLWLFMDTRISFWAGMGIPVSLLGGLAIVNAAGISLNKVTLFGLIMVLGIVADDAIVVGESIFYHRKQGASAMDAVVKGVSEVGLPVIAAVLTTIVAFFPLYHIEGMMGKFIVALPTAVIACLSISLLECMIILPAHLSNLPGMNKKPEKKNIVFAAIEKFHTYTVNSMEWAAETVYMPLLKFSVAYRYVFVSICIAALFLCAGLILGGFIKFNVFPPQAANIVVASVEFPEGTPFSVTKKAVERIEKAARTVTADTKILSKKSLVKNTLSTIGQAAGAKAGRVSNASPNVGGVRVTLLDPEESGIHSDDFLIAWEKAAGEITGVESLDFSASRAGPPGGPVQICIQGENLGHINSAAHTIAESLNSIEGVSQVFSDNTPGKDELTFHLKKEAEYLGISLSDLASQVYNGYYGAEALKIQRGNDEVKVNVRFTAKERNSLASIQDFLVKTQTSSLVPLRSVANLTYEPGFSSITRKNGLRQVVVTAKVDTHKITAGEATDTLEKNLFPRIKEKFPDVQIHLEGDAKRSAQTFGSLYLWIPISIMGMFMILATMFRSYVQPLLVLLTIPFGIAGAVLGHFIMGYMLSLLSVFGMVALTGIVVNDAIVMIERINVNLEQGLPFFEAVFQGGLRRFRAVMLTSISTVGGLTPLILETSQHARQLIPMAISLAFGVAFATLLTLILIPCLFTIINDLRYGAAKFMDQTIFLRNTIEPAFMRKRKTEPVTGENL